VLNAGGLRRLNQIELALRFYTLDRSPAWRERVEEAVEITVEMPWQASFRVERSLRSP
jgi:hypothetical protein